MKKLSILVAILLLLSACAAESPAEPQETQGYEHKDFVSDLPQEDCYLCGNGSDPLTSLFWGEDNVGIINLNTFELLRIEINRYDDHGQLIEEGSYGTRRNRRTDRFARIT